MSDPKQLTSPQDDSENNASASLADEQSEQASVSQQRKETQEVITPYAFGVAAHLFGTPLASPVRRGSALLIDLIMVGLLSGVNGNLLALVIAFLFWRSSNRIAEKVGRRKTVLGLRILSAITILGAVLGLAAHFIDDDANFDQVSQGGNTQVQGEEAIKTVLFSGKYLYQTNQIEEQIKLGECEPLICWQGLADQFSTDLVEVKLPPEIETEMINRFNEMSIQKLGQDQGTQLQDYLQASYTRKKAEIDDIQATAKSNGDIDQSASQQTEYSLISWFKGVIADLGLGFGWAAVYFTGTMVMFNGQTIGKKLLGIKVIKLDGSTLNVWESFGRYGGYGAGLATGLLGFLQIYWDPNRQAIQDKISETLVIRLKPNTTVTEKVI